MMRSSKRIRYRQLESKDCTDEYVSWLNDNDVNCFLEIRHSTNTHDNVVDYINGINSCNNSYLFGMFVDGTDGEFKHIGNIKVGPIDSNHPIAPISLFIGDKKYHRNGYGREAIKWISKWAFDVLGIRKLYAGMYAANIASQKAFEKAGYTQEGRRIKHYMLDGEMVDILEYGLIKPEKSLA